MDRFWSVGKVGSDPIAKFATHDLAAEYIGGVIHAKDPEGVERGDYYLDSHPLNIEVPMDRIWCLTIETKYGDYTRLFREEEDAEAALKEVLKEHWNRDEPMPDDLQEALELWENSPTFSYLLEHAEVE